MRHAFWQDYLWAYFGHHYGGGFHDIKVPSGSWAPSFERFEPNARGAFNSSVWVYGVFEPSRGGVACRESAASDDPGCLALRAKRGESADSFQSVLPEASGAQVPGAIDSWDRTRGACCERVRDNYRSTLQVQQHIIRPRTALTNDWLRLAHASLDYKRERLARFPPQNGATRCCMNHEGGYPVNWAELKGEICFPLYVKHAEHVRGGMPQKPFTNYRGPSEDGGGSGSRMTVAPMRPASTVRPAAPIHPAKQGTGSATRRKTQVDFQAWSGLGFGVGLALWLGVVWILRSWGTLGLLPSVGWGGRGVGQLCVRYSGVYRVVCFV